MNSIGKAKRLLHSLCNALKCSQRGQMFHASASLRGSQFYPINDDVFGLNEDQKQLRQSVFNFCQAELAPFASDIDKNNGWPANRVSPGTEGVLCCCANANLP